MSSSLTGDNYLPPGEREELTAEVANCDREADSARKNDDQQQLLVRLERGLYLRRRLYAESSPEVTGACRRLCEACNFAAMAMLQKDNMKGAYDLLKRAEQVSEKSDVDRAITLNNLACYYRRMGKLRAAVTFLERALGIEEHAGNADAAQTHLNLCATLSQLQRHADALYHAQSAVIRVYELLSPLMLSGELNAGAGGLGSERHEQVTVLCIAYHNLAVEHEYLKNFEHAIRAYTEGLRWATRFLSPGHQLIGILKDSVEAVKGKLPPGSAAFKQCSEPMNGWGRSSTTQSANGAGMDHLITPRNGDGAGRTDDAEGAGGPSYDSMSDEVSYSGS